MTNKSDDKNLRDFLNKNESDVPKASADEFLNIQRKFILDKENQRKKNLWSFGPAALSLGSLVVAAFFTVQHFKEKTPEVTNTEIAQMIWNSYEYLDDPMADPLEEIY